MRELKRHAQGWHTFFRLLLHFVWKGRWQLPEPTAAEMIVGKNPLQNFYLTLLHVYSPRLLLLLHHLIMIGLWARRGKHAETYQFWVISAIARVICTADPEQARQYVRAITNPRLQLSGRCAITCITCHPEDLTAVQRLYAAMCRSVGERPGKLYDQCQLVLEAAEYAVQHPHPRALPRS